MKKLLIILFLLISLNIFATNTLCVVYGKLVTQYGTNVPSGTIQFAPLDTPKTNSLGAIIQGSVTETYINDGYFAATLLSGGTYNIIVGPFNITRQFNIPDGTTTLDLSTIIGDNSNSLITMLHMLSLSNSIALLVSNSVAGVSSFNGRNGAIILESNDVYSVDIAAEKIKFNINAYTADTNAIAFAVLNVDNNLSAATNTKTLIIQSLGKDPTTNATVEYVDLGISNATGDILDYVNNIIDNINNQISTNGYASTNYVNDAIYNATNGLSTGSMDYSLTNHFATTNYVNLRQLIGDTNVIPSGDYAGVFKDPGDASVLIWNNLATKWIIPATVGFDFTETPTIGGASISVNSITNNFATISYVNTSTNNFITTANAQALTNNFATKSYAESLTNNLATTNFVANIKVEWLPGWSQLTNSLDSSEFPMGKSLLITNLTGDITFTGPTWQTTSNFESRAVLLEPNGANRTITIPASWRNIEGKGSIVVTNGISGMLTVGGIQGKFTNCVFQLYWR